MWIIYFACSFFCITYIKKYIDPDIEKMDREKGLAPTLDNVSDFYGSAELVVADISKTKSFYLLL